MKKDRRKKGLKIDSKCENIQCKFIFTEALKTRAPAGCARARAGQYFKVLCARVPTPGPRSQRSPRSCERPKNFVHPERFRLYILTDFDPKVCTHGPYVEKFHHNDIITLKPPSYEAPLLFSSIWSSKVLAHAMFYTRISYTRISFVKSSYNFLLPQFSTSSNK